MQIFVIVKSWHLPFKGKDASDCAVVGAYTIYEDALSRYKEAVLQSLINYADEPWVDFGVEFYNRFAAAEYFGAIPVKPWREFIRSDEFKEILFDKTVKQKDVGELVEDLIPEQFKLQLVDLINSNDITVKY